MRDFRTVYRLAGVISLVAASQLLVGCSTSEQTLSLTGSASCASSSQGTAGTGMDGLVSFTGNLSQVTLNGSGTDLRVTWLTTGSSNYAPPAGVAVAYWLHIYRSANPKSEALDAYAEEYGAGFQRPVGSWRVIAGPSNEAGTVLAIQPTVASSDITLQVPTSALPGLAKGFSWSASMQITRLFVSSSDGLKLPLTGSLGEACPNPSGGYGPVALATYAPGDLASFPQASSSPATSTPQVTSTSTEVTTTTAPGSVRPCCASFPSTTPPAGLTKALKKYFANPSTSGVPVSELVFSAYLDPKDPSWALYFIAGSAAFSADVQDASGIAHLVGSSWTIVVGPGTEMPCSPPGVPQNVLGDFGLLPPNCTQ